MIKVYFDGCCEPYNPGGTAAFGVVIFDKEKGELHRKSQIVGRGAKMSNNVAEYSGLKHALEWLKENGLNKEEILFLGDSKLVINQIWGTWQMKGGLYFPIALDCLKLIPYFPNSTGQWISREFNNLADQLSKQHLKESGVKFRIQPE